MVAILIIDIGFFLISVPTDASIKFAYPLRCSLGCVVDPDILGSIPTRSSLGLPNTWFCK